MGGTGRTFIQLMNIRFLVRSLLAVSVAFTLLAGSALADDHNYQVTGPVLSVTPTSITLKKGASPWTVSRDSGTVVTGDLEVGSKVTIKYHMVADTVAVK
jgi:hypothetical protein